MIANDRILQLSIVTLILFIGCRGEQDTDKTGATSEAHASQVAFRIPERDLVPEGICWDPVSGSFFLGSIQKHKILRISMDGTVETFLPPRFGGLWGVIGIRVDAERRWLWANSDQGDEVDESVPDAPKETGIFKFNADDGSLIKKYTVPKSDENDLMNDVTIAKDGTIYITSFARGMIYMIDSQRDELEEFLQMSEEIWNNGIVISPDERFLFVVGNEHIFRVSLESREMIQLPVPEGDFVGYGDGLYFYDRSLIAITAIRVNGVPVRRVLRLHLSDDLDEITTIQILDQDHPLYSVPTTGAIVDDWFYYIATSHLDKFDEEGNLAPWDELSDTYILRLRIN